MARPANPLPRTIGLTIRALRHERGLSQEALAELAHIDRSYMSGIERGLRNVSVLNVARIAPRSTCRCVTCSARVKSSGPPWRRRHSVR